MSDSDQNTSGFPLQLELLAGSVLGDLSEEEQKEFDALTGQQDLAKELGELERTAAAIELAFHASVSDGSSLPQGVRSSIIASAKRQLDEGTDAIKPTIDVSNTVPAQPQVSQPIRTKNVFHMREATAWIACAAALLLSLGLWGSKEFGMQGGATAVRDLLEKLQAADDTLQVAWTAGNVPLAGGVSGDITWNTSMQQGVMRFDGLPVNDPTVEQYQLWIIDPKRDNEPIDGGVFNVSSTGEVLVPVDAKLDVIEPSAFAITIEKPGGVVVSTQKRLPLLAPVEPM